MRYPRRLSRRSPRSGRSRTPQILLPFQPLHIDKLAYSSGRKCDFLRKQTWSASCLRQPCTESQSASSTSCEAVSTRHGTTSGLQVTCVQDSNGITMVPVGTPFRIDRGQWSCRRGSDVPPCRDERHGRADHGHARTVAGRPICPHNERRVRDWPQAVIDYS